MENPATRQAVERAQVHISMREILRIGSAMWIITVALAFMIGSFMIGFPPLVSPHVAYLIILIIASVMLGFGLRHAGKVFLFGLGFFLVFSTAPDLHLFIWFYGINGAWALVGELLMYGWPGVFFYAFRDCSG